MRIGLFGLVFVLGVYVTGIDGVVGYVGVTGNVGYVGCVGVWVIGPPGHGTIRPSQPPQEIGGTVGKDGVVGYEIGKVGIG
jgi:hypothetical protein